MSLHGRMGALAKVRSIAGLSAGISLNPTPEPKCKAIIAFSTNARADARIEQITVIASCSCPLRIRHHRASGLVQ